MQDFIVSDEGSLKELILRVRRAQEEYAAFSQSEVDRIFYAAAVAANGERLALARLAVEETGMGVFEDKAIKNHFAAENIYNAYKNAKTCGVIEEDESAGFKRIAEPIGLIFAIIPTTNPTSTAIFKCLLSLKTRNGLIISPHPRAKKCTAEAARIISEAAQSAGAPKDIIGWIDEPNIALSGMAMRESDLILATGGGSMVHAAYSSGKPAIGVGAGNVPAVVDSSADIRLAASSILHSKTFDNGMICASEQAVIVLSDVYDAFKREMTFRGAYFLTEEERQKVGGEMIINGSVNSAFVGRSAQNIASLCGFSVAKDRRVLVGEVSDCGPSEPFSHEKLSPVLAMYRAEDFEDALKKAECLLKGGGMGHTASLFLDEKRERGKLERFIGRMKACRVVVNTPSSHGGIGDLYNFRLPPSLTLGCGSRGGNSVSENVGIKHLLNIKTVAIRRENMLWFRAPRKIYFKRGSLFEALKELKGEYGVKRAFIVTDEYLYGHGYTQSVEKTLFEQGISFTTFFKVESDPTLATAREGAKRMAEFKPDVVIALGGGSPMDAAQMMRLLYEEPEADFLKMSLRFMDIRRRVFTFPKMKTLFIAVPTTAGTGSEVTPFAVITDEKTGIKYPLADYELLPDMAIADADLLKELPKGLIAAAGVDALSHALEALVSLMASDFTDALSKEAILNLVYYLPKFYEEGDEEAKEKVFNAATMAGLAFANAFLGVCHSMAHKLGSYFHIAHGVANALLLEEVIRFNGAENPKKMGTFSQVPYPQARAKYAAAAKSLNLKGKNDEELVCSLIKKVGEMKKRLNIPATIKEALGEKYSEEEFLKKLDKMSQDAFDDQCTAANPRYPLVEEIKEMYLRAYYGKGI